MRWWPAGARQPVRRWATQDTRWTQHDPFVHRTHRQHRHRRHKNTYSYQEGLDEHLRYQHYTTKEESNELNTHSERLKGHEKPNTQLYLKGLENYLHCDDTQEKKQHQHYTTKEDEQNTHPKGIEKHPHDDTQENEQHHHDITKEESNIEHNTHSKLPYVKGLEKYLHQENELYQHYTAKEENSVEQDTSKRHLKDPEKPNAHSYRKGLAKHLQVKKEKGRRRSSVEQNTHSYRSGIEKHPHDDTQENEQHTRKKESSVEQNTLAKQLQGEQNTQGLHTAAPRRRSCRAASNRTP